MKQVWQITPSGRFVCNAELWEGSGATVKLWRAWELWRRCLLTEPRLLEELGSDPVLQSELTGSEWRAQPRLSGLVSHIAMQENCQLEETEEIEP